MKKVRAGTFTLSIVLIALGAMMILSKTSNLPAGELIAKWWPIVIILLGVDFLICTAIASHKGRQSGIDILSIILIVILVVGFNGSYSLVRIFSKNNIIGNIPNDFSNPMVYAHESKFTKDVSLSAKGTSKLKVYNQFGDIDIAKGTGDKIEISADITIRNDNEAYAQEISEKLFKTTEGKTASIESDIQKYIDRSRIKGITINYTIKIPDGISTEVENKFGKTNIDSIKGDVDIDSSFGAIKVNSIYGDVDIDSSFGDVDVTGVTKSADVTSKHGKISIQDIKGDVKTDCSLGATNIDNVSGQVTAKNESGSLDVSNIKGAVKLDNSLGTVTVSEISSSADISAKQGKISLSQTNPINSDVKIEHHLGDIDIYLPKTQAGKFYAKTEHGSITSNFGLNVQKKDNSSIIDQTIGSSSANFNIINKQGSISISTK